MFAATVTVSASQMVVDPQCRPVMGCSASLQAHSLLGASVSSPLNGIDGSTSLLGSQRDNVSKMHRARPIVAAIIVVVVMTLVIRRSISSHLVSVPP